MSTVPLQINDTLGGISSKYKVKALVGHGAFGKIALCTSTATSQALAIKVLKQHPQLDTIVQREIYALEKIKKFDLNKKNIVKFIEGFRYKNTFCLVFEKLDQTLHSFIEDSRKDGSVMVPFTDIGVIIQQVLMALNTLRSIGLIHGDLKPDNIMIVNRHVRPLQVKLIDFGEARVTSRVKLDEILQASCYRAPEVFLGLPITEAVDMWGLGCIVAFMFLKAHLYPLKCEYAVMKTIVRLQGQPDDSLLDIGIRTKNFFTKEESKKIWRLNTPTEYSNATGKKTKNVVCISKKFNCLDDLEECSKDLHTDLFLSLLKKMLHVNYLKRITPGSALNDAFIKVSCRAAKGGFREKLTTIDIAEETGKVFVDAKCQEDTQSKIRNFCSRTARTLLCCRRVAGMAAERTKAGVAQKVKAGHLADEKAPLAADVKCHRTPRRRIRNIWCWMKTDGRDEVQAIHITGENGHICHEGKSQKAPQRIHVLCTRRKTGAPDGVKALHLNHRPRCMRAGR